MIDPRLCITATIQAALVLPAGAQPCDPWTLVPPNPNPSLDPGPRGGHSMVYDAQLLRMVMFGGSANPGFDDVNWFYRFGTWTGRLLVPRPTGRESHSMAYDSDRNVAVLFGGRNPNNTDVHQTWEYDGDNPIVSQLWQIRSTTGPSPRSNHAMVYDSRRCRTVLFGGQDLGTLAILNDTWEWDGNQWEQKFPATVPPPNAPSNQMAYDEARGVTVLRTDQSSLAGTSDTIWEWDGVDWTPVVTPGSPQRGFAGMTYDSKREVVTLFGGVRGFTTFNDVWEYDGVRWTNHPQTGALPEERNWPAFVYKPDIDRTVLFGGNGTNFPFALRDTWEHDDTFPAITNQPESTVSPVTGSATLRVETLDATAHQWRYNGVPISDNLIYSGTTTPTLHISGLNLPSPPTGDYDCVVSNACGQIVSHQAQVDASACHPLWTPGSNTEWIPRAAHAQAYNGNFGQTIFHGGRTATNATLGDTWTFNGSAWNQVFTVPTPPNRFNHVMATHEASGSTIMFGGTNSSNILFNDVWLWNGFSWTQLPPGPPALHSAAMSYDSIRHKIVLFGGTNNSTVSADTYEWDPVNGWVAVFAPGPKGRYGHAMAFDPASGNTVMSGGFDGSTISDETWEYDGTRWRLRSTQGPPPATDMAMAYDQRVGAVVVSGDFTGTGFGQTWKWDSGLERWTELTDTNAPAKRDHAMSYHVATQQMISTNGVATPSGSLSSTVASMSPPLAPNITQIVANPALVKVNKPFTLTASATGAGLSYQWFKDGVPLISTPTISGVNGPVLTVNPAVMANSGNYACVVSSPCGSDSTDIAIDVLCLADCNDDQILSPADFTCWLAAFGAQALPYADQNCDTLFTPADFTAWLANYNAGCP